VRFKKGDRVRHKYRDQDEGRLTVVHPVAAIANMVVCVNEQGQQSDYFWENLELDKSAIINDILKEI